MIIRIATTKCNESDKIHRNQPKRDLKVIIYYVMTSLSFISVQKYISWIKSRRLTQALVQRLINFNKKCKTFKFAAISVIGHFLCSVISQSKVPALDTWATSQQPPVLPRTGNETIFRWRIDLLLTMPKIIVLGHLLFEKKSVVFQISRMSFS